MAEGVRPSYREGVAEERHLALDQARTAYARRDFDTAYHRLAEVGPERLEADDLGTMADAAWWMGLTSETIALTEEVYRRYLRDGHVDRAALGAIELAFVWSMRGDTAISSGWLHRARRLLDDRPTSEAHGLLVYVDATAALESLDLDAAVEGARELRTLGEQLASPTLQALGLLTEGLAVLRRGDLDEGFALLDESMLPVLADQIPADWAGNIYCNIMLVCHELADFPRARQWTEAMQRWCRQFSSAVMFLGICRAHRVQLMNLAGQWDEAAREADQVRADLADVNVDVVGECEYQLGELHRLRGETAAAREAFSRARTRGRDPQPGEALLDLHEGRPSEAWAAVTAALAGSDPSPFRRARLLLAKVEIGLGSGHVAAAAESAEELAAVHAQFPTPGYAAWSDHAQGAVLLEQGRAHEARSLLLSACRAYERLPDPYQAARTRHLLARALREDGDPDGAAGQEAIAVATLRRLGAASAPAVRHDRPGGLTDRELEVLASVAAGATNQEAAERLFISEKTVRRHLANIYAKLGVGSRTAAAAWAHAQGLVPGAPAGSAAATFPRR